jgi:elongation factor G
LLETLYSFSNEMMELALEEREIPFDLIRRVIREATLHGQVQPVLCGAALHGLGIQPVLDAVGLYLPSPADRPAVEGVEPGAADKRLRRAPAEDEPFCGLVFKILPAKTGDLYWVRVYSGILKANSRVLNPQRDKRENVAQLWQIHATRKERDGQVERVMAGDIVGVIGPRHSITGDTLCEIQHPIMLPSIHFADTVISMAIEPESAAERKKLSEVLDMLKRQDPTFHARENEETGQTIISGMGELHLEVIQHRLLRDFRLNVRVHKPRVSYRETIERTAEVTGECHRQIGGRPLFARLKATFEPVPQAKQAVQVLNVADPNDVPPELAAVAVDEMKLCGEGGGPIGSFPLSGIRVRITGGEASLDGSDEVAFRIAAADAFEKGMQAGGPVLLEPVMRLNITTPAHYLGDIVGDLQQRRAVICRTENRGLDVVLESHAPLRELFGYANAIRSLSQGRAGCSMEPLHYAPAPPEVGRQYGL